MSDKMYTIDDILKEIKENKIDVDEIEKYKTDFQKFDTTALLDDILGRESEDPLRGISGIESFPESLLSAEEDAEAEKLLKEILEGKPLTGEEPEPKPAETKPAKGGLKPLRPLSSHRLGGVSSSPLQSTPATAKSDDFSVHIDEVTRLISKVELPDVEIGLGTGKSAQAQPPKEQAAEKKPPQTFSAPVPKAPEPEVKSAGPDSTEFTLDDLLSVSKEMTPPEKKVPQNLVVKPEAPSPKPAAKKQAPLPPADMVADPPIPEVQATKQLQSLDTVPVRKPEKKAGTDKKPPISIQTVPSTIGRSSGPNMETPTLELSIVPNSAQIQPAAEPPKGKKGAPKADIPPQIRIVPNDKTKKTISATQEELEYIALRKSRESKIQGFELDTQAVRQENIPKRDAQPNFQRELENDDLTFRASTHNLPATRKSMPVFHDIPDEDLPEQTAAAKQRGETPPTAQEQAPEVPPKKDTAGEAPYQPEEDLPDDGSFQDFSRYEQAEDMTDMLLEMKHSVLFRFAACLIVFVLGMAVTVLNQLPVYLHIDNPVALLDAAKNPMVFCIVNAVLAVALFAVGFDTVKESFVSIIRRDLDRSTLLGLSMVVMLIVSLLIFTSPDQVSGGKVFLYTPFLSFIMMLSYRGRLVGMDRMLGNFAFVSDESQPKYATHIVENQNLAADFTKGTLNSYPKFVCNKKTPFLSSFLTESFSEDATDRNAKFIVPVIVVIALLVAIASFWLGGSLYTMLTAFSGILILGTGVSTFFVVNGPLRQAQQDLSESTGVVLGYNAVEEFREVNSVLVAAKDLFEPEDVTLYGIKTFSNMSIDRAILDATSVLCDTKSILSEIFLNIISDRKDYLDPVDTVIYEDGMGISAWIKDRRVLIGSRELMINHNIDVPSKDYEERYIAKDRNLIYLSAAGELSAVFVIGLSLNEQKRNMLVDIYNQDMVVVVKTVDSILTKSVLCSVFDMPNDAFRVIPSRLHKDADALTVTKTAENGMVANNGNFAGYIYSMLIAKMLNKSIVRGVVMNYICIGLGILLFIAFTVTGSGGQMDNLVLCLYSAVCFVVIRLVQKFKRLT